MMRQEKNEANGGELIRKVYVIYHKMMVEGKKVVCVIVVVVFMTLTGIAVDKPEIDVPPNQHHPDEAPANSFVSQLFNYSNSIVVAANTANVAADSRYNISIS